MYHMFIVSDTPYNCNEPKLQLYISSHTSVCCHML